MMSFYKSLLLGAAVLCLTGWGVEAHRQKWKKGLDGPSDPSSCNQMRGPCRIETDVQNNQSFFNISCDCTYGYDDDEEASTYLEQLVYLPCKGKPVDDDMIVNFTSILIIECRVASKAFPDALLAMARRTGHLDINIQDSPRFRMTSHIASTHIVPKITATFSNSAVSGLVGGWFTGTRDLELTIEGSSVGVVDSKALLGFPPEAETSIQITNSNLTTIKMSAIELPAESTFSMDNCKVDAWNDSAYVGGKVLLLRNLHVARMLKSGINIRGLESFKLYNSSIGELTAEAIIDRQSPAMPRNERNDQRVALAEVSGNMFVRANGEAFVHLCQVEEIIFKNNQFMEIFQQPLRICSNTQVEASNTNKDWNRVFKNNGLPCNNCSDFSTSNNNQVCSMYTSSHCTCSDDSKISSCQEEAPLTKTIYDACYVKVECQSKVTGSAASTSKKDTSPNDALSLPRASALLLVITIMIQIGSAYALRR